MGTVIDVHTHVAAPDAIKLAMSSPLATDALAVQDRNLGPSAAINADLFTSEWLVPLTDPVERVARMDKMRVDRHVVSISPTQYFYWADAALADDIATAANAAIAAHVGYDRSRMVGFAYVSLQHPQHAADQLRAARRDQGLRGVEISTTAGPLNLSDRALDPFWAAAEELDAPIVIHPWGCDLGTRLTPFYLTNTVGNPVETATALSHVIFGGVFDRFPRLRVCAVHGGGYLPYYIGRSDHAYEFRPEARTCERRPSEYLSALWWDSLVYRADTLHTLIAAVGGDRVVLGSDYPFDMGEADPYTWLESALGDQPDRLAAIAQTNALAFLGEGS